MSTATAVAQNANAMTDPTAAKHHFPEPFDRDVEKEVQEILTLANVDSA